MVLHVLQVGNSLGYLTRNVRRIWSYPPFEPPPLHICNQEERTIDNEVIGVEERVGEERREATSEEEDKVSATSPRRVSVPRSQTPNSQFRGNSSRLRMVNQDSTLRLPMFHGMGRDDAEKHWFTCEVIWSVKRITDEASKIVHSWRPHLGTDP
jgi:hypothetical protein